MTTHYPFRYNLILLYQEEGRHQSQDAIITEFFYNFGIFLDWLVGILSAGHYCNYQSSVPGTSAGYDLVKDYQIHPLKAN